MILTLLLAPFQSDSQAIVKRCEQYLANADMLSVSVKTMVGGQPFGNATVKFDRPNRLAFSFSSGSFAASYTADEKGAIEVDHQQRIYDQYPPTTGLTIYPSRMNSVTKYGLPGFLLARNLSSLFPKGSKNKATKNVKLGASTVDLIEGRTEGPAGYMEAKTWIDSSGKVIRIHLKIATVQSSVTIQQDLSNYQKNVPIPASAFVNQVPDGFSPYALPRGDFAISPGTKVPNVSLQSASDGRSTSLQALTQGKTGLLVFLDPDFPRNSEFIKSLSSVKSKIADCKVTYFSVYGDAAAAKSLGLPAVFLDPTQNQFASLGIPGAPFVYLVDSKGKVVQAFHGFDGTWLGLDQAIERLKKAK